MKQEKKKMSLYLPPATIKAVRLQAVEEVCRDNDLLQRYIEEGLAKSGWNAAKFKSPEVANAATLLMSDAPASGISTEAFNSLAEAVDALAATAQEMASAIRRIDATIGGHSVPNEDDCPSPATEDSSLRVPAR